MDSLNFSCQGESHISSGKVCQDYSYSKIYEDGLAIAVVCDGHGGKRYFRSDVGARIAAEVTDRKIRTFVEEAAPLLLKGLPFGQIEAISTQIEKNDFAKQSEIERAFRRLAGSIIFEWDSEVKAHAATTPIKEEEKIDLEDRWINEFNSGINLEKVYGCTLIACVYTLEFWFAFQIGDGKCFAVDDTGEWSEPIPWDERCFLNKTTSICDNDAVNEFRFCYDGTGSCPCAIILGSDGIDDSFGTPENQANFYVQILKSVATVGLDATINEIESTLPQLSKIGSQDDMSLAMLFDYQKVRDIYPQLIGWQIKNVERQIQEEDEKLETARQIQKSLEDISHPTRQNQIDLQYANTDEKRASDAKERLEGRLNSLMTELEETRQKDSSRSCSTLDNPNVTDENFNDESKTDSIDSAKSENGGGLTDNSLVSDLTI